MAGTETTAASHRIYLQKLLSVPGPAQVLALAIAVGIIVVGSIEAKLIAAGLLLVGVSVRLIDGGYAEFQSTGLRVRGPVITHINYADVASVERNEPQWRGWFGRLNRRIADMLGMLRTGSPMDLAISSSAQIVPRRRRWMLALTPVPLPAYRRTILLIVGAEHIDTFTDRLTARIEENGEHS